MAGVGPIDPVAAGGAGGGAPIDLSSLGAKANAVAADAGQPASRATEARR